MTRRPRSRRRFRRRGARAGGKVRGSRTPGDYTSRQPTLMTGQMLDEHGMIPMGGPDDHDDEPSDASDSPPTVKERNAVQQAVSRLLDSLAPERAAYRVGTKANEVERYRTPRGCVLQAAAGAVTVSWFPDSAQGAELGELQVVAWRGEVSHPARRDAGRARSWSRNWYCDRSRVGWAGWSGALRAERATPPTRWRCTARRCWSVGRAAATLRATLLATLRATPAW